RERAGAQGAGVGHERVGERNERVEEDWSPLRRAVGCGKVEMAGVADDYGIGVGSGSSQQPSLGAGGPERSCGAWRPVLLASLPDRLVLLDDVDSRAPQSRDHLRVARVATLVRSEVQDTHPP